MAREPKTKTPKAAKVPKEGRNEQGHFVAGNRIWETRDHIAGPPPKFATAADLWAAAVAYFEWVDANPLIEAKPFAYEGAITMAEVNRMRPMTLRGLCLHLGISEEAWRGWGKVGHDMYRPDLAEVIDKIEAVIWSWKFDGAAAGLLNANIIAREMGLADKSETTGNLTVTLPAHAGSL